MKCKIDFEECLKDSPKFRAFLENEEASVEHLEQKLERTIKLCTIAVDSGKEYIKNQSAFATSLWELQSHFQDEKSSHNALMKIVHCIQEMNKFHTILLDQASRTVLKNLTNYLRTDVKAVKDCKQVFVKVSESLDTALVRNAQANRNKSQEVTEAVNTLHATSLCFRHTSLDYVNLLIMLQTKKVPEILSTLLSYYQACNTYYHQGSDLCNDFEQFFKNLADDINEMRHEAHTLEKTMQNRHMFVGSFSGNRLKPNASKTNVATTETSNELEGYLFKRTSKGFKSWNRRWFYLCNNQLLYKKRGDDIPTIMEEDLRICTVRPINDSDRRYCFEVISPTKSHILQADSTELLQIWISALQKSIGAAIQYNKLDTFSSKNEGLESLPGAINYKKINWEQFLKIPGNSKCCDCMGTEPRWASINLGITLCIACSGVHRSLGVHYSKVRSLTLDAWEPEIIKVMLELGNQIVNKIYEGNIDDRVQRATENCSQQIREKWIKSKYVEKRFVLPLVNTINNNNLSNNNNNTNTNNNNNNNNNTNTVTGIGNSSSNKKTNKIIRKTASGEEHQWTVRRLRRRPKSKTRKSLENDVQPKENNINNSNTSSCNTSNNSDINTSSTKESLETEILNEIKRQTLRARSASPLNQTSEATVCDNNYKTSDCNNDKDDKGILYIGNELDGPILHDDIVLSSDQESTGGEDNIYVDVEDMSCLEPNMLLYKASAVHNLPVMCQALALGANKNYVNTVDLDRTPLHQAILSGSVMACEYLILNGVQMDTADRNGYTPLHLATERGSTAQAYLLLKHKAKHDIIAKDGQQPIDIAVHLANADIVTLLRLTKLNEEIGLSEQGTGEGDTYTDVMKDFSRFAVTQPQKLQRNTNNRGDQLNETNSTSSGTTSTNNNTDDLI